MRSYRVGGSVVLFIAFLGCRHVPVDKAAPVLSPSPGSAVTAEQLKAGREIYVSAAKCAHCHSPKPVYEHSADEWARNILPKMAKNSKLSPDEYQSVLAYVTAGSQVQPEKAGK
jgi:hypothetical protein